MSLDCLNLEFTFSGGYAKSPRFSIEEMFRDLKSGSYSLEKTYADGKRFMTTALLIAMAYTCATLQGQNLKQQALQKYIARPKTRGRSHKRHSAFHIGLTAFRWVPFWTCCQTQIQVLLRLSRNKIECHLRGLSAIDAVSNTL